ncbi:hypothetical protein Tco_1251462 [Tanacetum coccineum]
MQSLREVLGLMFDPVWSSFRSQRWATPLQRTCLFQVKYFEVPDDVDVTTNNKKSVNNVAKWAERSTVNSYGGSKRVVQGCCQFSTEICKIPCCLEDDFRPLSPT